MSTRAVTPDAPAASHVEESSTHPHSDFLPTGKEYRMTGVLPDAEVEETPAKEEVEEKDPPSKQDDPAPSESDTAAASEAAKSQKQEKTETEEKKPVKTTQSSESRWAKVTRENKELRERLQRLETANKNPRETQQEPRPAAESKTEAKAEAKPAANPRPKIDDVDPKTGKPKYASYEDYLDARDDWNRKEAIREFGETSVKTAKEREQQEAQQKISREWGERVEAAKGKYADYEQVALDPNLPVKAGSVVDAFILTRPNGTDVLYHLGKHPEVLDQINKMAPIDAAYALSEIALQLTPGKHSSESSSSSSSAKPITQAPRPPHQTSGKGAVTKDAVEQAAEEGDFETYAREQNARELAKRKKGK